VENERRSLARELHDDTIQTLIALNQRVQILAMNAPDAEKATVGQLQNLIQQSTGNLRRLIRGLRPIYLEDLGLVASLEMLVKEMEGKRGLDITVTSHGVERRLPAETAMAFYRMVQESINNVIHHADAAHARVELRWSDDLLTIHIRDDGKGFEVPANPSEFAGKGHFGLLGLHERADLIGARLEIHSAPGKGTEVRIQKNLTAEHTEHTE
jgi:signal transduction histidine kinase